MIKEGALPVVVMIVHVVLGGLDFVPVSRVNRMRMKMLKAKDWLRINPYAVPEEMVFPTGKVDHRSSLPGVGNPVP